MLDYVTCILPTWQRWPQGLRNEFPPPPGKAFKYLPSKPIQLVRYDPKESYGRSQVSPRNYPTGL